MKLISIGWRKWLMKIRAYVRLPHPMFGWKRTSGRVVTTDYDSAGRTAGVKNSATALYYAGGASTDATNRIKYTAAGAISTMKLGNGLWEHAAFNTRLQPNEIGLGTSCSGTLGTASRTGHESVRQVFGGIGPV